MNRIKEYLNEYHTAFKSKEDDNWDIFWKNNKELSKITSDYLKKNLKFLPENHIAHFHDSCIIGNVKPNMNEDNFNVTIRMLCYEKLNDNNMANSYQEVDPVYVDFTIDNKFRSNFHKLAVKSSTIMTLVYEDNNLGIAYLDKGGKLKAMYIEGIDLKNNNKVEEKIFRKFKM